MKPVHLISNTWGIPSIHGSSLFADLAYRTVLEGGFDALCVELPRDLRSEEVCGAISAFWPAMGVAVVRGPRLGVQRFKDDDREREVLAPRYVVPLSPSDSICASIAAVLELRKQGRPAPQIEFCDLPVDSACEGRTGVILPDPWHAREQGLEQYLEENRASIESARIPERDEPRDAAMASALMRHNGVKTLLVCGAGHFWRIKSILSRGEAVAEHSGQLAKRRIEAFPLSAARAWFLGFSDIPAAVGAWVEQTVERREPFHLDEALSRLRATALAEARDNEDQPISPRRAIAWEKFLHAKLCLAQRIMPYLDGDLVESARCSVRPEFAAQVRAAGLRYPYDPPPDAPQAWVAGVDNRIYLVAGEEAFLLRENSGDDGERKSLPAAPLPIGVGDRKRLGRSWELKYPPFEDKFQRAMMFQAWGHAERISREARRPKGMRASEFDGDFGYGLDARATMRAWALGAPRDTIFVRTPSRRDGIRPEPAAGPPRMCPVAWLFNPEAPVRETGHGAFAPRAHSSFYWIGWSDRIAGGLLRRESLGFSCNVLRGLIEWSERNRDALIASLDESRKPYVLPWNDAELKAFEGPDLAIASAIRWAGSPGRAIAVAPSSFEIRKKVWDYATSRGVELVRVPWDLFWWGARRRLSLQHLASSPGEFIDIDPVLASHCEPVPEELLHFGAEKGN